MSKKRVLFICSMPRGKQEIRFTDEIGVIEERLLMGQMRDEFDFVPKMAVRPSYLMKTVVGSAVEKAPYIVHFSLHGDKKQGLIFRDEKQESAYQTTAYFESLFEAITDDAWKIAGVIFSACHSLHFAEVVKPYVQFAIGVEDTIPDEAAIEFAAGFYTSLFDGWDEKTSHKRGRAHIQQWMHSNDIAPPEEGKSYEKRIFLI